MIGELVFLSLFLRRRREIKELMRWPFWMGWWSRFGPESLQWKECATPREFLHHGLVQSLGFHIVSGLALLFFSAIGKSNGVAFVSLSSPLPYTSSILTLNSYLIRNVGTQWRYILFFSLTASELALLFSPSPRSQSVSIDVYGRSSNFLSVLFPTRVPFQHIKFLHQVRGWPLQPNPHLTSPSHAIFPPLHTRVSNTSTNRMRIDLHVPLHRPLPRRTRPLPRSLPFLLQLLPLLT